MDLHGKTAVVTGGGSGVGLGVALALAAEGCRVAIIGRNPARLQAAATQWTGSPPLRVYPGDVADREQIAAVFAAIGKELGPADILVNSAGVNVARRSMADLDPADWDRLLAVNVTGAYNCIHAALPAMRERRSGLIVNICSYAGKRALKLAGVGYCASKFAMGALGTAIRLEEQDHGIRVTNIHPGEINTPILEQRPVPVPEEKKLLMLQPEDLAACVVLIAKLPPRAVVCELVITPSYQDYA